MARTTEEKISLLEEFDTALKSWEHLGRDSRIEGNETLRRRLNEMAPVVRTLVREAGTAQVAQARPPPMLGGPAYQSDPFDWMFGAPYGLNVIPIPRDITQQTIGVFRSGHVPIPKRQAGKENKRVVELAVPEQGKVTVKWLIAHVPVTWWITIATALIAGAVGILLLGFKAANWGFVQEMLGIQNYPH